MPLPLCPPAAPAPAHRAQLSGVRRRPSENRAGVSPAGEQSGTCECLPQKQAVSLPVGNASRVPHLMLAFGLLPAISFHYSHGIREDTQTPGARELPKAAGWWEAEPTFESRDICPVPLGRWSGSLEIIRLPEPVDGKENMRPSGPISLPVERPSESWHRSVCVQMLGSPRVNPVPKHI